MIAPLRNKTNASMLVMLVLSFSVLLMFAHNSYADSSSATKDRVEPLRIVYFHSPTCNDCREVKQALPKIIRKWDSQIELEQKSIDDMEAFNELLIYEEHYGVEVNAPPVIFVGKQCLKDTKNIINRLDQVIAKELSSGATTFTPSQNKTPVTAHKQDVPSNILSRFEGFRITTVAVAGLIDGVNPCAFTTIVFMLSMFSRLGKSKRQLIVVGTGFTSAVFVTYLLLGLGLLGAVKSFSVSNGLSSGLACGVGILAFVLAGWSLVDAVRYMRTGSVKSVTLGLPKPIKQKIHNVIRKGLSTRNLVVGSIGVGFLVSILESLCTGQVYLPTLIFVARTSTMRAEAFGYLLLYNLMFILPLVGILIIGYMGVKSEYMGNFLRRRLAVFKFGMAALFAGLGVLVMGTV